MLFSVDEDRAAFLKLLTEERITRARITQTMSLLDLCDELKAMRLAGHAEVQDWSIRREVG